MKHTNLLLATATATIVAGVVPALAAATAPVRPDDRATRGTGTVALEQPSEAVRPDDRAGLRGPGLAAASATASVSARPDDRANHGVGAATLGQASAPVRPDDRPTARGPGALATPVVTSSLSAFDWGDAGIGALGGAAIALLLVGGIVLVPGRRAGARVALR